jgi:hypothetical protein
MVFVLLSCLIFVVLSCLVLSCVFVLFCVALFYLVLSCLVYSCLVYSCLVFSCDFLVLLCPSGDCLEIFLLLSCFFFVLSCLVLFTLCCVVSSCLVSLLSFSCSFCLVLFILSCLVLHCDCLVQRRLLFLSFSLSHAFLSHRILPCPTLALASPSPCMNSKQPLTPSPDLEVFFPMPIASLVRPAFL